MYSDSFLKINFITQLIKEIDDPIIYLDFDLLYTGYVMAGNIPEHNGVLFQPSKENWNNIFKKIIFMLCEKKSVLIIDSLNGFFNLFHDKEVGRIINSYVMLLSSIAKMTGSYVIVVSMTESRINEKQSAMSLNGHQIIDAKTMTKFQINKKDSVIEVNVFSNNKSQSIYLDHN